MNVKLKVLSAGVLFFLGQAVVAQSNTGKKVDTTKVAEIDEVVVVGYKRVIQKTTSTATSKVTSEVINEKPNANAMNVVQGQLAGVNITASTGQPGAKPNVLIRGVGTLLGNTDPLYVIDGVPSNADNFRTINPNDIESIEALKDASAISQYGNRGANGIIIITTKRGRFGTGKPVFSYTSRTGISMLQKPKYDYASSKEMLTLEKRYGVGLGASLSQSQIDNYNIDTNWVNYFFRPGFLQGHDFSVSSGSANLRNYTSIGYLEQDGILKTTGLKRFSVRSNIDGRSDDKNFNYSVGVGLGFSKNNEATNLGSGAINRNYVLGAFISAPYISPSQYQNPKQLYDLYAGDGTLLYTPLMLIDKLQQYQNQTDDFRLDINSEVSYRFLNDFTARMKTGGQYIATKFFQSEYPDSFNGLLFSPTRGVPSSKGGAFNGFEDYNNRRELIFNNLYQLAYDKKFGDHTVGATANLEYTYQTAENNNFRQRGLNPKSFVPGAGSGNAVDNANNDWYVPAVSSSRFQLNNIGYLGTLDYDYGRTFGVNATIRRDGTSRFAKDYRWGTFWSVGGRINLEELGFMKDISSINVLKLRGSIGTAGNQRYIDGTIYAGLVPPGYQDSYLIAQNVYNSNVGYGIQFGEPTLRWETTQTANIGLDWEVLKRRFRGQVEVYRKKTFDIYYSDPTPPIFGTTAIDRNTSIDIINKGIELTLAYDLIKNENTIFTIKGNGAFNDQKIYDINNETGVLGDGYFRTKNGQMMNLAYYYSYIGVNQSNGNLLFSDVNGNPTENPGEADKKYAKYNNIPRISGGFGFDFDYKGFYLNTHFTYFSQVNRWDSDLENLYDPTNLGQFNVSPDLLNAWTPNNLVTNVPALNVSNLPADDFSNRFLIDASYVRLRNVQLGYKIPKRLLEGTLIRDLSINVQGENLYNWTKWQGFDPESLRTFDVYQYPTPRIYTIGFNVKF